MSKDCNAECRRVIKEHGQTEHLYDDAKLWVVTHRLAHLPYRQRRTVINRAPLAKYLACEICISAHAPVFYLLCVVCVLLLSVLLVAKVWSQKCKAHNYIERAKFNGFLQHY